MRRRQFFQSLALLVPGLYLYIPNIGRPESASAYLTQAWNTFMKGKRYTGPVDIVVGRDLFQQFEQELEARTMRRWQWGGVDTNPPGEWLAFKTGHLRYEGRGWTVKRITQRA